MHAFRLRALVVLFVLGSLVFAPASERVLDAASGGSAGLSALVLLPTVESAVGIDDEALMWTTPSPVVPLDVGLVAVTVLLISLLALLTPAIGGREDSAAGSIGQRAPPTCP